MAIPIFKHHDTIYNDHTWLDVVEDLQVSCANFGYSIVFGCGAKRPAFRGVVGKITVFQVMIFPDENQPKCNIEICLPDLQCALEHESDEELRNLFNDFPDRATATAQKEIRNMPQYLYYDLSYFKDGERRKLLLEKLQAIAKALGDVTSI
ncbi:MAG: hypothetical protein R3Y62_05260 [Eubacteriales bacterium]